MRAGRSCSRSPAAADELQRLFGAIEYLVVRRAPVEVREHRLCLRRHVCSFVVLAHEPLHAVEGVEPHEAHELNVVGSLAPDQVDGAEPWNAPRFDVRDHFAPHDALICVSVVLRRPASPQTADHGPQAYAPADAGVGCDSPNRTAALCDGRPVQGAYDTRRYARRRATGAGPMAVCITGGSGAAR